MSYSNSYPLRGTSSREALAIDGFAEPSGRNSGERANNANTKMPDKYVPEIKIRAVNFQDAYANKPGKRAAYYARRAR